MKVYVKASHYPPEIIRVYDHWEDEYRLLQSVVDRLNAANIPHRHFYLDDVYFDMGQDWLWTTIICRDERESAKWHHNTTQILSPRQLGDIVISKDVDGVAAEIIAQYANKH